MHSKGELLKKVNAGTSKKLNINCIASKLNILTNCTFLFVSQRFSSTSSSKNGDVLTGLCTWNRGLHKVKGFTARKTMLTVKFWKFIFRNGQGLRRGFHFRRVANLTSWKFFLYSIRFWNWKMITYWKEKIFCFSQSNMYHQTSVSSTVLIGLEKVQKLLILYKQLLHNKDGIFLDTELDKYSWIKCLRMRLLHMSCLTR